MLFDRIGCSSNYLHFINILVQLFPVHENTTNILLNNCCTVNIMFKYRYIELSIYNL